MPPHLPIFNERAGSIAGQRPYASLVTAHSTRTSAAPSTPMFTGHRAAKLARKCSPSASRPPALVRRLRPCRDPSRSKTPHDAQGATQIQLQTPPGAAPTRRGRSTATGRRSHQIGTRITPIHLPASTERNVRPPPELRSHIPTHLIKSHTQHSRRRPPVAGNSGCPYDVLNVASAPLLVPLAFVAEIL